MKSLRPIDGPISLDLAIEHARNGRPDLLLLLVKDAMGAEVADVLADLLKHPEKLRVKLRARFLPHEADAIRESRERLRKLNPTQPASRIDDELARQFRVSVDTLRDIVGRKHTYADSCGEHVAQRSPRQRKK